MRNLALLATGLFLALATAGCTSTGADSALLQASDATDAAMAPTSAPAPTDPGARPNWTHGNWYQFEVLFDNTYVKLETNDRLVVAQTASDGYELGAGNRNLGVIDAHFDDFFVGKLDQDLTAKLGAKQEPFKMFDWPLENAKTWKTPLYTDPYANTEDEITFTATKTDTVVDPRGQGPGFTVTGKSNLGTTITYTYSARTKWITEYEKKAADGRVLLHMKLKDLGANFTGQFHLVTMKTVYERVMVVPFFAFDPTTAPYAADRVTINEDFSFLEEVIGAFTFDAAVPPAPTAPGVGEFAVLITYPDNTPRQVTSTATGPSGHFEVTDMEKFQKGTYLVNAGGVGIGGTFVGYYGFTDELIEFSATSHAHHGG